MLEIITIKNNLYLYTFNMQTYTLDNSHPDVTQTNKPVVL